MYQEPITTAFRRPSRRCPASRRTTRSTAPSTFSRDAIGPLGAALARAQVHRKGLVTSSPRRSYFYRHTHDLEDSTYGTQQFLTGATTKSATLPNQPYPVGRRALPRSADRGAALLLRSHHNLSGTVGAFYSQTHTKFYIPPTYANGLPGGRPVGNTGRSGPWPERPDLDADQPGHPERQLGVRRAVLQIPRSIHADPRGPASTGSSRNTDYTADGFMNFGADAERPAAEQQSGIDPKVGLAYQVTEDDHGLCLRLQGIPGRRRPGRCDLSASLPDLPV